MAGEAEGIRTRADAISVAMDIMREECAPGEEAMLTVCLGDDRCLRPGEGIVCDRCDRMLFVGPDPRRPQ